MNKEDMNIVLDAIAGILLRCFILAIAVLLIWFVIYLLMGDFVYGIHAKIFNITRENFELLCYYGMAYIKASAFLFFLLPYIGIKLVVRKNRT